MNKTPRALAGQCHIATLGGPPHPAVITLTDFSAVAILKAILKAIAFPHEDAHLIYTTNTSRAIEGLIKHRSRTIAYFAVS